MHNDQILEEYGCTIPEIQNTYISQLQTMLSTVKTMSSQYTTPQVESLFEALELFV